MSPENRPSTIAPLGPEKFYRRWPFAGRLVRKRIGGNPYRAVGEERERLSRIASSAGVVGTQCEKRGWLAVVGGSMVIPEDLGALGGAWKEVQAVFGPPLRRRKVDVDQLKELYIQGGERLIEYPFENEMLWREKGPVPKWEALEVLFKEVDCLFGTTLMKRYMGLPGEDEETDEILSGGICEIDESVRIPIEGALTLGRIALEPISLLKEDEALVPDVRVPIIKGGTQFDALVIPSSLKPKDDTPFELGPFLVQAAELGFDTKLVEVRTNWRWRYLFSRALKRPLPRDIAQFQHRLGEMVWWWGKEFKTGGQRRRDFPFPKELILCYPRGSCESRIHRIPLDYHFFRRWLDVLQARMEAGLLIGKDAKMAREICRVLRRKLKEYKKEERVRAEGRSQALERAHELHDLKQKQMFPPREKFQARMDKLVDIPAEEISKARERGKGRRVSRQAALEQLKERVNQESLFGLELLPPGLREIFLQLENPENVKNDLQVGLYYNLLGIANEPLEEFLEGASVSFTYDEVLEFENLGFSLLHGEVLARYPIVPNWGHHPLGYYVRDLTLWHSVSIVDLDPERRLKKYGLRLILAQTEKDRWGEGYDESDPYVQDADFSFALCWIPERVFQEALDYEHRDKEPRYEKAEEGGAKRQLVTV